MDATIDRPRRASVILYALVAREGAEASECRVRNLSTTGACLDDKADFIVDEKVTVLMGALRPVPARVIWVERGFAGLRFDRSIDIAAARQPRGMGVAAPHAGWLDSMDHAYRRPRP